VTKSAHNLEYSFEISISEIKERMISLEVALDREAIIPATLLTSDDISAGFHIALNCPEIDWPFAEAVLERFLFLWSTEEPCTYGGFLRIVWSWVNDFDLIIAKLLRGGDCWRVRKSLGLIQKIIGLHNNTFIRKSIHDFDEMFDSLASILLQPIESSNEKEKRRLVYLIVKNQETSIDFGIARFIDSFLYSRKGKTDIDRNVLKILTAFIDQEQGNREDFFRGSTSKIPKALIKTLIEEKDADIIKMSLLLCSSLDQKVHDFNSMCREQEGLCEALICIMKTYPSDRDDMINVIDVICGIFRHDDYVEEFVALGLLNSLVEVFNNSPDDDYDDIPVLVGLLCTYNRSWIEKFYALGIPKRSRFWKRIQFPSINQDEEDDVDEDLEADNELDI
jgi:hypothetical protein